MRRACAAIAAFALLVGAACALDKPPANTAQPPPPPPTRGVGGDGGAGDTVPGIQFDPGHQEEPKNPVEPADSWRRRQHAIVAAQAQVDHEVIDLEATMPRCEAACSALRSLERAVDHLCGLTQQPDEKPRCEEAKKKLERARAQVRATCTCP
jgi:hypothetical protein